MSTRLTTHAPFAPTPQRSPDLLLQRKCAGCGNHTGGSQCSGCAKKEQDKLQRRAAGIDTMTEIPPIVNDVLNSPGQPLDTATRAFMEPRFRHDFSQVRVHADVTAAESARAVNAHAFTVGSHIVFDASKYAPSTTAGKNLLAHELTHVLQQSHGLTRSATFGIGPANDEHEQQADAVANAIVSTPGKPVANNARPLIPGTQQTVVRNDAPPPPPRTRLQRRSAEDELFDPFTGGESQAADGGGGTTTSAPEKPTCPKVPTKLGDKIPKPMCPTATHTGLSELNRFNFCLDSDELTDPSQLGGIPAAIARTRRSARFLIHGYASPEGNKDYNFRLACHRAIKIANEFRKALLTRLSNPLLTPPMLEAEVESRIETASQGPTSEFGKPEENRVAIVFEQVADKADPEPACKDAPRHIGDIQPEVGCDVPTRDLLHMDGSARLNQFHFCLDSDVLDGSDASNVRSFAQRQAASSTFVVHGFASVEGSSDYNQRLSCHRALRIFRELINAGVKQEQIVEVSGIGETDRFGEPEFNRVVSVLAEGGDTGIPPPGTRKTDNRKQREAVRDEAVARIMAGKYDLAADAYISFWTCGRTATVRQAVERLKIEVQDSDQTEQVRETMMGTEEGFGVNFIRLSNAALRADNSIECTMGRIIDSAFHHAAMTGDLPTTPVPDPNALPSDLTGPSPGARHRAGLHLIHLAGLSQCFGKNLEPHINPAHVNEVIGIDLPLEDDPRKGFVPNCAEAPQPTRLHTPPAGAKDREAPGFEVVGGRPTFTPNRGKLETNFDSEPEDPSTADQSKGDLITKPDKAMLTASATVQLKGQKDTFKDYEVGFIQAVIADEIQADYDSGHSVIQQLPTPIRLAEMKREPTVPAPWTSASSFARPDENGKVSLTASGSGLNIEAAIGLRRINRQLPNSGLHSAEQGSRIAIWLIARRLGAPLDRFSVHFLDGVFYDLTQLVHLEHRRIKGELDQTEPKVLRERELPVFIGSFLSSKPSELPEDPSSARLTGPIASDIGLFNQVREVVEARASRPTDMDKTQLRAVVLDILDNLQVFDDAEKARAGKDGRRMPRLGFDFIPLTITMPFVRRTGRLVNPAKKELVIKVTGPGLGFDAGQAIAEALEFRIRDRVFDGKEVVLRQEFIPGKGETGEVSMTLAPIPRGRGADPKTDPDVTRNPEVLRSMAEAWACTLSTRGFLFQGVEFCRAFWMDREKQLRGIPEDRLVRGETKIENGGASVSECQLPCLAVAAGTTAGVRLVGFHTHPEPDPQPTEADLKHARDCEAPKNYVITDNQAFRFTQEGLVDDEDPIDLPKGVTCDPKNLEGFVQPPE